MGYVWMIRRRIGLPSANMAGKAQVSDEQDRRHGDVMTSDGSAAWGLPLGLTYLDFSSNE